MRNNWEKCEKKTENNWQKSLPFQQKNIILHLNYVN